MHNKLIKVAKKATSVFVSLTTAIWLSGFGVLMPITAHGQSVSDLQAQIQSLLALVSSLQAQISGMGGSTSSSGAGQCTFTKDLTIGSTGSDVMCLQKYLNSAGHMVASSGAGSPGMESEYFGSRTQSAVSKWQAANGVSPTAGYFGSRSRAKYNSMAVVTPPPVPVPTKPQCSDGIDNDADTKIDYPTDTDCTDANDTTEAAVAVGTGVTIGTAAQPAATLAVENSIHLPFTAFTLTASADGDVLVDSITVERTGLANDAAFAGVVLLDSDMSPITAVAKTLNSTHQAVLTDDFKVPAGTTKTYYLAGNFIADMASYAGQVATLSLVAVNTTAQVSGALPIVGTGHTLNATLSIGSATLTRGVLDPGNVGPTKEVGTTGYIFSALKTTAGSAEDVYLKSIRWNQSGSAAKADLAKVIVNADGIDYTPTVSDDGKYYKAEFAGNGVLIKKGESKEVYIKADIASGSGRTIDFDLYRYDDMVFVGKTNGYKFKATSAEGGSTTVLDDAEFMSTDPRYDADQVEIGAGSLRVEKSNKVSATNIANGEDNVALGAFLFDVDGEAVTFNSWVLTVATTDDDDDGPNKELTNFTVYDANGNAVAGPKDLTRGATTLTFTDSITVPVGENIYTIRGDLDNNFENNDTIIVSFNPGTAITNAKGDQTGNTITPTPSATVTANTQTVKAGTLTVSVDQALGSQSYVEGGNGVELGRYVLDATASGEDLRVTVVKIRAQLSVGDLDNYQALQLFDGTKALNTGSNVNNPSGNSANTAATLSFNLDSPGLTVPKGTTKIISLKGNLTTGHALNDRVRFNFVSLTNGDWGTSGIGTGADVTETYSSSTAAVITIKTGGGWTVVSAPSQPTEKWVTAGATGVTVNVLRFNGTTEEFALTDLRLQIDTTGSSSASDISKVHLYDDGVLVQSKTPSFINGVEDFTFPQSGTGSFIIPKDGSNELTIKIDISPIGTSMPGKAGQLVGIDYDAATLAKNKAAGKESGSSVNSDAHSDVTGNGVVYFRSVPTLERLPLPVTALTSGNAVLYKFKVTADPAYDVAVRKVMFKVATTGVTGFGASLPSFTLWNTTDNRRVAAATGSATAYFTEQGNYSNVVGEVVVRIYADNTDLPSGQCTSTTLCWDIVPKGQSRTYELRGSVTTDGTGDSISTKLLGDDARPLRLTLTGSSAITMAKVSRIDQDVATAGLHGYPNESANVASSSSFIWSDFSSDATTTHSNNTADWMNGFKVPGLLSTGLDSSTMSN